MDKYTWIASYNKTANKWNQLREKSLRLPPCVDRDIYRDLLQKLSTDILFSISCIFDVMKEEDFKNLGLPSKALPVAYDVRTGEIIGFATFQPAQEVV